MFYTPFQIHQANSLIILPLDAVYFESMTLSLNAPQIIYSLQNQAAQRQILTNHPTHTVYSKQNEKLRSMILMQHTFSISWSALYVSSLVLEMSLV